VAQAKIGDTVRVHYEGSLADGTVFDSSRNREPFEFTLGEKTVIDGFENAVIGMEVGEKKRITIPPEEAYGPHLQELVIVVPRDRLPDDLEAVVGMVLELHSDDGRSMSARVTELDGESVTLDANHPLAGESLTFEIELMEIL